MKTLIIYDLNGRIITQNYSNENITEPYGIPFIYVEVPENKHVTKINTSITPHEPVFEQSNPTEVDFIKKQFSELQYTLMMNGVI